MYIRKRNIWKSLLFKLVIYNAIMVVVWTIRSAFGYTSYYWLSFCITNAIAILMWLFQIFISDREL